MRRVAAWLGAALWAAPACAGTTGELAEPVRIEVAGAPIDVEIGHAAPFVGDFTGDGQSELLVGQFGEGKLRIYRNVGTADVPVFEDFTWFEAAGKLGTVPTG